MESCMSDLSKRVIELSAEGPQCQRDLNQEESCDDEGDMRKNF